MVRQECYERQQTHRDREEAMQVSEWVTASNRQRTTGQDSLRQGVTRMSPGKRKPYCTSSLIMLREIADTQEIARRQCKRMGHYEQQATHYERRQSALRRYQDVHKRMGSCTALVRQECYQRQQTHKRQRGGNAKSAHGSIRAIGNALREKIVCTEALLGCPQEKGSRTALVRQECYERQQTHKKKRGGNASAQDTITNGQHTTRGDSLQ